METPYGAGARFFHWTTAALVLAMIPMGIVMIRLDRGILQNVLFVTHESLGLTVFVLTALRLAWRLGHGTPPPSPALAPYEVRASWANHALLYLLLLVMPVSGYLFVVWGGFPLSYFELAHVPRLVEKDEPLSKLAEATHLALQWAVYALVLLHVAAALHHHVVRRNDVFLRMWPRRNRA
jgi:cytochrome b561